MIQQDLVLMSHETPLISLHIFAGMLLYNRSEMAETEQNNMSCNSFTCTN